MKRLQLSTEDNNDEDSWLDDEVDAVEPLATKRPCLDNTVSKLISLARVNDSGAGTCGIVNTEASTSSATLANIAQEFQMETPCSPPVLEDFATIVNNLARDKLPDETIATKFKLYDRPSNCGGLTPVKVDPPIWDKLKSEMTNDLNFKMPSTKA